MTSLAESEGARRARHFCALERRLFEVLGGWVPSVPEPEVKILLRRHSFEHAGHADLWAGLLPVGEDGADAQMRPAVSAVLDLVAEPTDTVERLMVVYQGFLASLMETYGRLRDGAEQASDGPVQRVLARIASDDAEAGVGANALLTGVFGIPSDGGLPSDQLRRIESALRESGGLDYIERV